MDPLPKGFSDDVSVFSHFLVTAERCDLLEQLERHFHTSGVDSIGKVDGIVPSGPAGIGKSCIGWLFASYAFVNSQLVVPIWNCNWWLRGTDLATVWLQRLIAYNADLLATIPTNHSHDAPNLLQVLTGEGKTKRSYPSENLITWVLKFLSTQAQYAIVFIFDEHQVLYEAVTRISYIYRISSWSKNGNGSMDLKSTSSSTPASSQQSLASVIKSSLSTDREVHSPSQPPFVLPAWVFVRFDSLTTGQRCYTMYIGSAHSQFEFSLDSYHSPKIVYLQPWTTEAVVACITNTQLRAYLPSIYYQDLSDQNQVASVSQVKLNHIQELTGDNPRELWALGNCHGRGALYKSNRLIATTQVDVMQQFEQQRTNMYFVAEAAVYQFPPYQQQALQEFLVKHLTPRFELSCGGLHYDDKGAIAMTLSDKNMIYRNMDADMLDKHQSIWRIVSKPAQTALLRLLSKIKISVLRPISQICNASMKGIELEQWIIYSLLQPHKTVSTTLTSFFTGFPQHLRPANRKIRLNINTIKRFGDNNVIPTIPKEYRC